MLPTIGVQICTFSRPREIRLCIDALLKYLHYSELIWLVCDDSTGGDYVERLAADYPFLQFCITPRRAGWGVNVNLGLDYLEALGIDYIYFTEDDYILTKDIDLNVGMHLLQDPQIGLVRYDGLAGHRLDMTLEEMDYPGNREGVGIDKLTYARLLKSSRNLNIYSNRPHLKHRRFHDYYGRYIEGQRLGMTETNFAHRVRDIMVFEEAPQIVALPEYILRHYDDIGVSFQHTQYDQEIK